MKNYKPTMPKITATGHKIDHVTGKQKAITNLQVAGGSNIIQNSHNGVYLFKKGITLTLQASKPLQNYAGSYTNGINHSTGIRLQDAKNQVNIIWAYGDKIPSLTQCNFYRNVPLVFKQNLHGSDHVKISFATLQAGVLSDIKTLTFKIFE